MIKKKSWEDFRKTGLLCHANRFLHIFGWAIVVEYDREGEFKEAYPARVKFRGFDEETTSDAFIKTSTYMRLEAEELDKEAKS